MKTGESGNLRHGLATVGAMLAASLAAPAMAGELPELECLIEPYVVIDIGSPTHGIVDTLAVDRSDVVKLDDVLARLDSTQQGAAVRKARARAAMESEIRTREAELALAERKQERMRELYNSDAISSHARDEVETELKRAQMQLRQAREAQQLARIELERARDALKRRTIRSPIAGVVVERFVAPGEYVNEKPLMRLAQLHPLRIEAIAPAALFGEIEPGMQASVATFEGAAETHSATVTIVDRMIDAASGTFGIRLELPNPDYAIPSGLNCRLRVMAVAPPPPARTAAVEPEPVANENPAPAHVASQPEPAAKKAIAPAQTAAIRPEPVPVKTTPESEASCRTFGPFSDTDAREVVAAELADIATAVRARDESTEVPDGYLVTTPQPRDRAEAIRIATELKARGVKDVAVLTRGAFAGNVSLGWFRDRNNAQVRQQALESLGVQTQKHERLKPGTQLWLDAEISAATAEQAPWRQTMPAIKTSACSPEDYVAKDGVGLARTAE